MKYTGVIGQQVWSKSAYLLIYYVYQYVSMSLMILTVSDYNIYKNETTKLSLIFCHLVWSLVSNYVMHCDVITVRFIIIFISDETRSNSSFQRAQYFKDNPKDLCVQQNM